ncbi:hypothetical protein AM571_PC01339 (plasmid) [Rhizobium etli 8C-3]|uniref:Uncharacterized protein n=1 Tax=Rhizobium etli 8C-3 TaxID=538025 RepID=A0A1L5PFU9_RHIET|nr:hypothetical protein AM571_PC01339 [Rhizobium etli 8C-3]
MIHCGSLPPLARGEHYSTLPLQKRRSARFTSSFYGCFVPRSCASLVAVQRTSTSNEGDNARWAAEGFPPVAADSAIQGGMYR